MGFPEAARPAQVEPAVLLARMEGYGPGTMRSRAAFLERMGVDLERKVQATPAWCNRAP